MELQEKYSPKNEDDEYGEQTTTYVPEIKKNRTEIEETTVNKNVLSAIIIGVSSFVTAVAVAVIYFCIYYKKSNPKISSLESLETSMTTTTKSLYTISFEDDELKNQETKF